MAHHLRFAGSGDDRQTAVLSEIIRGDALLMALLEGIEALDLPDGLLTSGVIYNTVWNVLTGRPPQFGIRDADIAYFDDRDPSYEAENAVILRTRPHFEGRGIPVEVRNQARVHLWFPGHFGFAYPRLISSADMLNYFTTRAYAVGARQEGGRIRIFAPFGLDDLFSFRLRPNPVLPNRATHEAKAARAVALWPELEVEPWPD